jgi:hypothetical protein
LNEQCPCLLTRVIATYLKNHLLAFQFLFFQ